MAKCASYVQDMVQQLDETTAEMVLKVVFVPCWQAYLIKGMPNELEHQQAPSEGLLTSVPSLDVPNLEIEVEIPNVRRCFLVLNSQAFNSLPFSSAAVHGALLRCLIRPSLPSLLAEASSDWTACLDAVASRRPSRPSGHVC